MIRLRALAEYNGLLSDFSVNKDKLIIMLPPFFRGVLTTTEIQHLQAIYNYVYPNINIVYFSSFYEVVKKCEVAGEYFTSCSMTERTSVIMAYWPTESYNETPERELQAGYIKRFIKHTIKLAGNDTPTQKTHVFCQIEWCMKHFKKDWYGASTTIYTTMKYAINACSFMPVQRIAYRCAYGKLNITFPPRCFDEQVLVIIPIHLKYAF